MASSSSFYRARFTALSLVSLLLVSGCAAQSDQQQTDAAGYPVTVSNCGHDLTFYREPQRVVLLKSAAVPALHSLGVMDRVVARAGAYPEEYYDQATREELAKITQLSDDLDSSGHLHISKDIVIGQEPDLVLGEVENLDRSVLASVDIPLIEESILCKTGQEGRASFDTVYSQLETYGEIFQKQDRAQQTINELKERVEAVRHKTDSQKERTAAILYPTVGGATTFAYGTESMAQPQLEAAGFKNVFDDVDQRVFEVTPEELISRNPDVLILLYSSGAAQDVKKTLTQLPCASALTAVKDHQILVQLMNYTEPGTPLAVTGLEKIVDRFYQ